MKTKMESSNLDLLRSMAVLFVLGFHIDLYFLRTHAFSSDHLGAIDFHQIGQWGVLMFFVHTSMVLMFSLERQEVRYPGRPLFSTFLLRRIFRIYPLSVLVVFLVWLLRLPAGDVSGGRFVYTHLSGTALFSNYVLLQNIFHAPSIVATLWSLPYEMEMYLVLPCIYLLARRAKGLIPVLLLWGGAVFLNSHTHRLQQFGFGAVVDLMLYAPCFLAGIIAFKETKLRSPRLPAALWPLALVGITFIYLRWSHAGYLCCFLLGLAIPQFRDITNSWICKGTQIVARYSYGIYLTHFICIWLAFQALSHLPMWFRWAVLMCTVILFPWVLYHCLEEPMIRAGGTIASKFDDWRQGSSERFQRMSAGA